MQIDLCIRTISKIEKTLAVLIRPLWKILIISFIKYAPYVKRDNTCIQRDETVLINEI